jgi:hypothetical protein
MDATTAGVEKQPGKSQSDIEIKLEVSQTREFEPLCEDELNL